MREAIIRKKTAGFTLIEVIVAVVIVGILVAIAVPSYQDYVRKTRRTELTSELAAAAQALERRYTTLSTYNGATLGAGGVFPNTVPTNGNNPFYTLALEVTGGGQGYTLTATAAGVQVGDPCGNFTLTAAGARTVSGTKPLADCWRY